MAVHWAVTGKISDGVLLFLMLSFPLSGEVTK